MDIFTFTENHTNDEPLIMNMQIRVFFEQLLEVDVAKLAQVMKPLRRH